MSITIIGLGPGDPGSITRAAWEQIQHASTLYLRTLIHPTVASLPAGLELRSFDQLYEQAGSFEAIYSAIAGDLVQRAEQGTAITYAVPGDPLTAEATTRQILRLARERGVQVRVLSGVSFIEPVCAALELDPLDRGLQLIDALDLVPPSGEPRTKSPEPAEDPSPKTQDQAAESAEIDDEPPATSNQRAIVHRPSSVVPEPPATGHQPPAQDSWASLHGYDYEPPLVPFPLVPTRPALICQLYQRRIASDVKLSLMERYPASHQITLVRAAGVAGEERVWRVPLYELDHQEGLDHLTCAFVPALAPLDDRRGPDGLAYVVMRLLAPGGCPWDREQTPQSMRAGILGETYEVLEALDANDFHALSEELGDLLMNILSQAEMARQAGEYGPGDVYEHVTAKLIRRHPHVFGNHEVAGSAEVLRNWDAIKQAERTEQGRDPRGTLDGIPPGLPALATAQELARKAAKVGFVWPSPADAWRKLDEEIAEIQSIERDPEPDAETRRAKLEWELGDLLFAAAVLARALHVDAETALRTAGTRFRIRFQQLEHAATAQGRALPDLSLDEMLALWEQAKRDV